MEKLGSFQGFRIDDGMLVNTILGSVQTTSVEQVETE
jgi:hypothetical protein